MLPVAVIEITRQQNKSHFLINYRFNQIVKGTTSRAADFLNRSAFITLRTMKRTIEMNICSVKEFHNALIFGNDQVAVRKAAAAAAGAGRTLR